MFRRLIVFCVATVMLTFQLFIGSATAVELDEATRTVKADQSGNTVVISVPKLLKGKKLFNDTCAQCHAGGVTKTNQNVGLDPEALALATPPRNNIEGLVDYMKEPTTYDGEIDISELHPSKKSENVFKEMRNLTDDDLEAIAAHVLIEPKIVGIKWGGGKIHY
jgi:photosystem II cytochrome c550